MPHRIHIGENVAERVAYLKSDRAARGGSAKGARGRAGDHYGVSLDLLIAEIAQLKERVASLERAAFSAGSEYVETWSRAAALLGIDEKTAKRRHAAGDFPMPCRLTRVTRGAAGGGNYDVPTWRRADLVAYAEGC